jgi:hypothetical protein
MKPGDSVIYVPRHSNKDTYHKDCEVGVVKSMQEENAFVNYHKNGMLQETAQRTSLDELVHFPFEIGDEVKIFKENSFITYNVFSVNGECVSIQYNQNSPTEYNYRELRLTRDTKLNKVLG